MNPVQTQGNDYGIKISSPNYNALNCQDWQLTFNSSWPQLPIAYSTTITVNAANDGGIWSYPKQTIPHSLGFYPFADLWMIYPSDNTGTYSSSGINHAVHLPFGFYIGKEGIYIPETISVNSAASTVQFHVKIYNLDITQEFSYNYLQPAGVKLPYTGDNGLKMAKPNKGVNSNDMRDFIIHSRCQSPQLLSVTTEASANNVQNGYVTYTDIVGATNWVYGLSGNPPLTGLSPNESLVYQFTSPGGQAAGTLLLINFPNQGQYSLIFDDNFVKACSLLVFRDPLFYPNQVMVSYG